MKTKGALRITSACLGIDTRLIAIQHGIFGSLHGSRAPNGLMFNAIGSPCQPEAVWHACFQAMGKLFERDLLTFLGEE